MSDSRIINGLKGEVERLFAALQRAEARVKELEAALAHLNGWPPRVKELTERNAKLVEALEFYANPETYYAIGFFPDPPCGDFIKDFSDDHGDDTLPGFRPGKRARAALQEVTEKGGPTCPRPANAAPPGPMTVKDCIARGECGCDETKVEPT